MQLIGLCDALRRRGVAPLLLGVAAAAFSLSSAALAVPLTGGPGGFNPGGLNTGTLNNVGGTPSTNPPAGLDCVCTVIPTINITYDPTTGNGSITTSGTPTGVTGTGTGTGTYPTLPEDKTATGPEQPVDTEVDGGTITFNTTVVKDSAVAVMNGMKKILEPNQTEMDKVVGAFHVNVKFKLPCASGTGTCDYSVTLTVQLDNAGNPTSASATSP